MSPHNTVRHVHRRTNQAAVNFVILELDTGLMFCSLASSASAESVGRIMASAKRSYDAAIHYVNSLNLNADERLAFEEKKETLRICLVNFGFVV
jgi:hypothetical protein